MLDKSVIVIGAGIVGLCAVFGLVFDHFEKQFINQLIIDYLKQFAVFKYWSLIQSCHGIYPKRTKGETDFIYSPEDGVTIVNDLAEQE